MSWCLIIWGGMVNLIVTIDYPKRVDQTWSVGLISLKVTYFVDVFIAPWLPQILQRRLRESLEAPLGAGRARRPDHKSGGWTMAKTWHEQMSDAGRADQISEASELPAGQWFEKSDTDCILPQKRHFTLSDICWCQILCIFHIPDLRSGLYLLESPQVYFFQSALQILS